MKLYLVNIWGKCHVCHAAIDMFSPPFEKKLISDSGRDNCTRRIGLIYIKIKRLGVLMCLFKGTTEFRQVPVAN